MCAELAGVVTGEDAGGLGVGQQVGALAAQQIRDGLRVAQGDAEHGVADRRIINAAPVDVGQRIGVGLVEQERVDPQDDRGRLRILAR